MTTRLFKIQKSEQGHPTELRETPIAYFDGTLTGIAGLEGRPIEIQAANGRIECKATNLHATAYSVRGLNRVVAEMLRDIGPQAFDALSSTRDLEDYGCFLWDSRFPQPINPTMTPAVINGAPLPGHTGAASQGDPDDDDDDDDDDS